MLTPPEVLLATKADRACVGSRTVILGGKEHNPKILAMTRMCKFFSTGQCARGQACSFAHSRQELRPQPDLYKTQLCLEFGKRGKCLGGMECTFAHTAQELRSVGTPIEAVVGLALMDVEGFARREAAALHMPVPVVSATDLHPQALQLICSQFEAVKREAAELQVRLLSLQRAAQTFSVPTFEQQMLEPHASLHSLPGINVPTGVRGQQHTDAAPCFQDLSRQTTSELGVSRQCSEASFDSWKDEPLLAAVERSSDLLPLRKHVELEQCFDVARLSPPPVWNARRSRKRAEGQAPAHRRTFASCPADLAGAAAAPGGLSGEVLRLGAATGWAVGTRNTFITAELEAEGPAASRRAASAPAAARAAAASAGL